MLWCHRAGANDLMKFGMELCEHIGALQNAVERPRERRRSGLVPGNEEGDQLVAQFDIAHRLTLLVACIDEHGKDIRASSCACGSALRNLSKQDLIHLVHELRHALPSRE